MSKASEKRIFYVLLGIACAVAAAKILFTGYDIDEQYAVSMSWRMLRGDRLLRDMWEPHQTSGGLCALLMGLYTAIDHTTDGIILYLRICGLLLHGMTGIFLYRTLAAEVKNREYAFLVSCIYFFALPKIMFLPEFSNIQVWCLVMVSCCMLRYYAPCAGEGRRGYALGYLVAAGCFLALEVLAYPSTILTFAVCAGGIVHYRHSTPNPFGKELLCLTAPCLLGALLFLAWLLGSVSPGEFWELVSIVMTDGSHSAPMAERLAGHGMALAQIAGFFVLYALAAGLLGIIWQIRSKKAVSVSARWRLFLICSLCGQVLIWLFGNRYPNYPMVEHIFLLVLLLGAAVRRKVKMSPVLVFCVLVPFAAFLGILLFSNHPLLVSLPFLGPCTIGILSLPELRADDAVTDGGKGRLGMKAVLMLWVCVLLFGRCYMQRTTGGQHYTIWEEHSLMREGPAAGLVADTPSVIRYRDNYRLVGETLPDGAKVFYLGTDTDIYLMKELEFCTPSTISSPTFDDKVLLYFQKHPEKKPDYIVCDAEIRYSDPWVADYIGKHCQDDPVAANDYIIVYKSI